MMELCQGDIIKINGFKKQRFLVVSKNAFIRATGMFHVCPMLDGIQDGPIHILVAGKNGETGTVLCEQIKLIDPISRGCNKIDYLSYADVMNISDVIQGIFEYD